MLLSSLVAFMLPREAEIQGFQKAISQRVVCRKTRSLLHTEEPVSYGEEITRDQWVSVLFTVEPLFIQNSIS